MTDRQQLADALLARVGDAPARRAGRTLPHPAEGLLQTVLALLAGAELAVHEAPGAASLQVLRGRARLVAGAEVVEFGPHQLAPITPRRHSLQADDDTAVLLTVAAGAASG